jgi:hypothetical protein
MSMAPVHKRNVIDFFQRHIANPITRRLPTQVLLETTGRISGQPRTTPIGGRRTISVTSRPTMPFGFVSVAAGTVEPPT